MRVGTISALCALLSSILTPSPGVAQSSPESRPTPQSSPEKSVTLPNYWSFQNNPGAGKDQLQNGLAWRFGNPQQAQKMFGFPKDGDEKLATVPPGKANCAHIVVFQAPETDSEMAVEVPPGTGGNITTFKGLEPCPRDFHFAMKAQLPGPFFRRRGPFFRRPLEQFPSGQPASDKLRQNEGPTAKP